MNWSVEGPKLMAVSLR